MTETYYPQGVCSRAMNIELENGLVKKVSVVGGCNGNLQGICRLVEGKKAEEVIALLRGIRCGGKPTSCPDQLARALEKALAHAKEVKA